MNNSIKIKFNAEYNEKTKQIRNIMTKYGTFLKPMVVKNVLEAINYHRRCAHPNQVLFIVNRKTN